MSTATSDEYCWECGQAFTLVATAGEPPTADRILALLRQVCCVCDRCLTRVTADDPPATGEQEREP